MAPYWTKYALLMHLQVKGLCSWDLGMFRIKYRDGLKGGPVLLSNSHAGPGRNFTQQPRAHLLVNPCTTDLGALQRDELCRLVGHGARRLRAGGGARRGLSHRLLLLVLEPLLPEVALGRRRRLETLHRLRPCRSSRSLRSPEFLGGNSIVF